jgi:hypothetical protein
MQGPSLALAREALVRPSRTANEDLSAEVWQSPDEGGSTDFTEAREGSKVFWQ